MIWFFERHHARLSYEIRRATDGSEYELVITFPDGNQVVEAFSDATVLMERSARLRDTLAAQGWCTPAPRLRPSRRSALTGANEPLTS